MNKVLLFRKRIDAGETCKAQDRFLVGIPRPERKGPLHKRFQWRSCKDLKKTRKTA